MKVENKDNELIINDVVINIVDTDLVGYRLIEREDLINDLIDWISEAKGSDKCLMKEDLEYLLALKDEYVFSSINTNEYIAKSVDEKEFNKICEEILKLNEVV